MDHLLTARRISAAYGPVRVLDSIDIGVAPGELHAVCGANGSGKSTLLRVLARLLPGEGEVQLDGRPIAAFDGRALARRLAFLPQHPESPADLTVRELVAMGRHPHAGWLGGDPEAAPAVRQALESVGLAALADRPLAFLSGGQRQRAWIALTLAQRAAVLLLDEPTNHLDLAHQVEVMDLLRRLCAGRGLAVIAVLHDVNLAATYADRLTVLDHGRVAATGAPQEVLTAGLLRSAWGLAADVIQSPIDGRPLVVAQRTPLTHPSTPSVPDIGSDQIQRIP